MQASLLTDAQIEAALPELDVEWSAIPGQGLVRVFTTGSFNEGVALLASLAKLADKLNHHPDVHLTFDEVEVTLTTHSAGGVTNLDIEMAKAIDAEQKD